MGLGKRIYTLWKLRPWVIASFLLAVLAAIVSVAHISLAPPKLTPRSLQMATGTTHVIVDTPRSSVLDLRQNTYSFQALSQRAVLLGNVMANGQVRQRIAAAVNVPVDRLQVTAPLTPKQPRPPAGAQNRKKTSDLLKSTDQYRISIEANPTVPVLDIYAQAPTARDAEILANTSIVALHDYLKDLAAQQRIPPEDQIRLLQLGKAQGKVITKGIDLQVAFIAFVLTFAFGCATAIFISRVDRGLRLAALADREHAPA